MKKILLCLCLFSSAAYANQCEIIDTELAASYSEMKPTATITKKMKKNTSLQKNGLKTH